VTPAATEAHQPSLAAGEEGAPRRSLLLAGGGIRVAYQAGVLVALEEAGLRFHHADGTSGGIFNLAMLLSGVSPEEACRRWRALKVLSFASVWPLRRLLAGPPYPALGTSEGIRQRVFPALGVNVERIRSAQGMDGTFNVCDFAAKECIAVPHTETDLDVLTAGVSLPVFSPAVERDGRKLVDAVWIKDTNVAEALRRGVEELWLVWCIGNHGVYRDGAFQQYVHMIEIAANGALQEELALVRERGARLHVIRPRVPLPLDPDFFFGRVDASTLIAMGYRDAAAYLDAPHEDGVAPDAAATRMEDPVPGVAFRERLSGNGLELRLGWEVDDLAAFAADPKGTVVGDVTHPELGTRRLARSGHFRVDGGRVTAELRFGPSRLELRRSLRDPGSAEAQIDGGEPARLARSGPPAWRTLHARGVGSAREGAGVRLRFSRWLRTSR
jgi:predicted acylesterase/phospholipase RssA